MISAEVETISSPIVVIPLMVFRMSLVVVVHFDGSEVEVVGEVVGVGEDEVDIDGEGERKGEVGIENDVDDEIEI